MLPATASMAAGGADEDVLACSGHEPPPSMWTAGAQRTVTTPTATASGTTASGTTANGTIASSTTASGKTPPPRRHKLGLTVTATSNFFLKMAKECG